VTFTPSTWLSSVVMHELLVGASTGEKARQIRDDLLGPLLRTGRMVTPSHTSWKRSATALSAMARMTRRDLRSVPKSLVNDFLLAASCREAGAVLITDNRRDLKLIGRFIECDWIPPWPEA
jgi:predicted nucleic acid-binding protein